jgi:hypothetical protein
MASVRTTFVAKAIYGLITVQALLVVMEEHPPTPLSGAMTLLGATLAVALIDTYSEIIAEALAQKHMVSRDEVREILRSVSPVLVGSQAPTLMFLLSAIGLWSVEQAIQLAQLVTFLFLFVFGVQIGRLLHTHWLRQVLSGIFLVAVAGMIVGVKILFH